MAVTLFLLGCKAALEDFRGAMLIVIRRKPQA